MNKIESQDKLEDAINIAYTQLSVLEDLSKTKGLDLGKDYFKEKREYLGKISPSVKEPQLDWETPFRECETPVFDASSKTLQLIKERELKKQGIEIPAGYKLIPKGFFEQGTNEKEVKNVIGYIRRIAPDFLNGFFPNMFTD